MLSELGIAPATAQSSRSMAVLFMDRLLNRFLPGSCRKLGFVNWVRAELEVPARNIRLKRAYEAPSDGDGDRARYTNELRCHEPLLSELARSPGVDLSLYSARDEEHNDAVVPRHALLGR
jgi:uncharacterized protein YeaO (DUF488 family)